MPTGYTADVGDGKVTDFSKFAMTCARAFGALVTMRDDPFDAAIPDAFAPSDHHEKRLQRAQEEVTKLLAMSPGEKSEAAARDYETRSTDWSDYELKKAKTEARYEAMLTHVREWVPPTEDHAGLKKFMIEQLEESIRFDCGPPYSPPPTECSAEKWYESALERAKNDVEYHTREHTAEIYRARVRTEWVQALRASLAPTQPVN